MESSTTLSAGWSLVSYVMLSLALTLHVKMVMQWLGFGLPWLITSVHSLGCITGIRILAYLGYYQPTECSNTRHKHALWLFSILYTANVAVSNMSLYHVSVPLHQVIRGTVPLFTVLVSKMVFQTRYSISVYLSLVPVVLGVTLTTYGDYAVDGIFGLLLTVFGAFLAATKTVATNGILSGNLQLKLSALDLLYQMSPLVFIQTVVCALVKGELFAAVDYVQAVSLDGPVRLLLLVGGLVVNAVLAFLLNVASFNANKKTSALAMTVAGNIKVALTVLLGCLLFSVALPSTTIFGILVTLVGGALYSSVRYKETTTQTRNAFKTIV